MVQRFVGVSFWLALLICFVMAVTPAPVDLFVSDKSQHMAAFAALTALALLCYREIRPLTLFACLAAFGGLIEIVQGFVGRDADVVDWTADLFAIAATLAVAGIIKTASASFR